MGKQKTLNNTILQNLIQESIASLEDVKLSSISVSKVLGDKNSSDAKVYILHEDFDENEILKSLKKASNTIIGNAFISSGWVHFPKLTFFIDTSFDKQQRIEELFNKIKTSNDQDDE